MEHCDFSAACSTAICSTRANRWRCQRPDDDGTFSAYTGRRYACGFAHQHRLGVLQHERRIHGGGFERTDDILMPAEGVVRT